MVLLVVLVILLIIGGTSASFIWFMNQQQSRVGLRYRSGAAVAAAEAGVHRALSILETVTPDGRSSGRTWRPRSYTETLPGSPGGRFTISVGEEPDGGLSITSAGEVAGVSRRVRVRVYLASPGLLAGLYGAGVVLLAQPPAATVILPYGAGIGDRPWVHIAAGRGIWFATTDVSINDPSAPVDIGAGPLDAPQGAGAATRLPPPGPVRLLLAGSGELTLGRDSQRVDIQQLRAMGVYVEGVTLRTETLRPLPEVDVAYYRTRAVANTANAGLNAAVGKYFGDGDLERKRDSLYTEREFERIQVFLKAGLVPPRMRGIVYVAGGVGLLDGERLHVEEGALITESTVHLSRGASLAITHAADTRTLPAIIVLGNGALFVTEDARLRAHGLVFANRSITLDKGAHVDVVGAVAGNDGSLSFRNSAATVIVRYDPAVLGTPGLRVPSDAPAVAWVATWEELP